MIESIGPERSMIPLYMHQTYTYHIKTIWLMTDTIFCQTNKFLWTKEKPNVIRIDSGPCASVAEIHASHKRTIHPQMENVRIIIRMWHER